MASATLLPLPASAQLTREAQALNAFAAKLDQASTAPDFVGFAVAVVRDGRVSLVRTYGVRELGRPEKVTPDTVFRIASLSKGFAGAITALEVKDGDIKLSDPISRTSPQFRLRTPKDTAAVTVEDVLAHRTGLPPFAYDNLLEAGVAPLEILGKYSGVRLTCAVGGCYTYQNSAFNMIEQAIQAAAGKPYTDAVHERLIQPLGLKSMSFGLDGLKATGDWARPHIRRDGGWRPVDVKQPYYAVPAAGGMNASITDLALWVNAQMGARPDVLPADVVTEMTRPRVSTPAETNRQRSIKTPVTETHYGLGWRTFKWSGHNLVTHSGGVEGYFANIAYLPERKSGIVILSNTRGARAGKILPTWLDYELGLEPQDWFQLEELAIATSAVSATTGAD